jgi:hypothetical protein
MKGHAIMNAIRIKWPTGIIEPMADIKSSNKQEAALAREQARAIRAIVCKKA